MSIRRKTLLGMALLFFINLVLMGGYYALYLRGEVAANLKKTQTAVEDTAYRAAALLSAQPDADPETLLSAEAFPKYDFKVTDVTTGAVLLQTARASGDLDFRAVAVADRTGRAVLVEATKYFYLGTIRELSLIRQLILAEIAVMAVILALIALALQSGLLRPLAALNERMSDYRKGKAVPASGSGRKDELGQLAREFDRLMGALDEEKRVQERIVASISHDIKTPLTSVMGYVERLQKGNITDEARARRYLETIYERARNIDQLVCEFDDYLLSSEQALRRERIGTDRLCEMIRAEYEDELSAAGARLTVENDAEGLSFSGDPGKLRRVFGNLISNAVRHARPEGPLQIHVRCARAGNAVRFSVSDNGRGVPPEERERIFEPFRTGNASRGGGSGLGLAICKSIARAHGGTIEADASPGGGLRVTITLPLGEREG